MVEVLGGVVGDGEVEDVEEGGVGVLVGVEGEDEEKKEKDNLPLRLFDMIYI